MLILRRLVCSAAMRIATQFALILLASNLAANGQHCHQVTISTGPSPRWIAVADVNHDHNPDIVVANAGLGSADSGSITVFLGAWCFCALNRLPVAERFRIGGREVQELLQTFLPLHEVHGVSKVTPIGQKRVHDFNHLGFVLIRSPIQLGTGVRFIKVLDRVSIPLLVSKERN
jgi:hypothetical protein